MRRFSGLRMRWVLSALVLAALALVLSACGGSSSTSTTASTATSSTSTTGTGTQTTSTAATTTGGTAALPPCPTSGLSVSVNPSGSGAAGSVYYTMTLTNKSGYTCTLTGYPGVSGVTSSGVQLGNAASRNPSSVTKTVTLTNGASATSTLQVTDVGNFPSSACAPASAWGLRIYPPNQTSSVLVKFPFQACAKTGPSYLSVSTVLLAAPTPSGGATSATTPCTSSGTVVSLDTHGSGAAGSFYYTIDFANHSGRRCTLAGYPGVSAVNASGAQLGRAAARNTAVAATTVTLANGAVASATLQILDVDNILASTCAPTEASGLRVYVPNQTASSVLPFTFRACGKVGPTYLYIWPIS